MNIHEAQRVRVKDTNNVGYVLRVIPEEGVEVYCGVGNGAPYTKVIPADQLEDTNRGPRLPIPSQEIHKPTTGR